MQKKRTANNVPKGNFLLRLEPPPQRGERGNLDGRILEFLFQYG